MSLDWLALVVIFIMFILAMDASDPYEWEIPLGSEFKENEDNEK